MYEVQLKNAAAKISEDGSSVVVSGKLGSTKKSINRDLLSVRLDGGRLVIEEVKNKKLSKKADLAGKALGSELAKAVEGVEKGIERKMKVIYAHFPMTVEVKEGTVQVKNIFGEKRPRVARIMGDTKVEVKGQELYIKGVDAYDVGQTVANITKLSFVRRKDVRIFQDGIYEVSEE